MIYSINGQKFDSDFLEHHGIKGQKWGVRRYQNSDGTWTELGKKMRRLNFRDHVDKLKKLSREVHRASLDESAAFDAMLEAKISKKKIDEVLKRAKETPGLYGAHDEPEMREELRSIDQESDDRRRFMAIVTLSYMREPKEYGAICSRLEDKEMEYQYEHTAAPKEVQIAEFKEKGTEVHKYEKEDSEYYKKKKAEYKKIFADLG